ncbi:MAG: hypothetical protein C4B55_03390 [Candidatus Methanophagaceae archaeon]|nr:MAG: hypothetical protein C4B55_03390 [Methanophagales archaeon]
MDTERLWEILYKERNTATLQELPRNFCAEVREYLKRLEEERREAERGETERGEAERENADERRRGLVEDELRNARMKVEDIIRRRVGKIVKLASSGVSVRTPSKGMLEEERAIFEGVKSHVEAGRERIFALISGAGGGEEEVKRGGKKREAAEVASPEVASPDPPTRDKKGKKDEEESEEESKEEFQVVRALEDLPTFMGIDGRIYKVKKEDVLTLPKTNAEILCNRGVAVRLRGRGRVERKGETETKTEK